MHLGHNLEPSHFTQIIIEDFNDFDDAVSTNNFASKVLHVYSIDAYIDRAAWHADHEETRIAGN